MVLFDQASYDKMLSEVPKFKQITPSVLSERLRVSAMLCPSYLDSLWYLYIGCCTETRPHFTLQWYLAFASLIGIMV
jgi:S25 ribosomal protein